MTGTSHVSHLECSATGERYQNDRLHGLSRAGAPLLVRLDLLAAALDANAPIDYGAFGLMRATP